MHSLTRLSLLVLRDLLHLAHDQQSPQTQKLVPLGDVGPEVHRHDGLAVVVTGDDDQPGLALLLRVGLRLLDPLRQHRRTDPARALDLDGVGNVVRAVGHLAAGRTSPLSPERTTDPKLKIFSRPSWPRSPPCVNARS